ncbi:hypothetical protein CA54_25090 [Symmachiella macrocystis]|uniref:Uncharacterized protein n=1 Tax=Symmachiella macrocystis TaxID=2527985 RepID=A0A5C6BSJ1_9PLAN|nr:hypothetical protein [Symmachiella macrocystis]TWU13674.1 hypothetical protein CA54_25090 [Symmachiella macrocystis]
MSITENQGTYHLGPELNGIAMTVYHQTDQGVAEQIVPEMKTYRTDILPGFELPITRLFAAADRWGKD